MKIILYAIYFVLILFMSCADCIKENDLGCQSDGDCCQNSFFGVNCETTYTEVWVNCRGCQGTKESCDSTPEKWCRISGEDGVCKAFEMD